MQQCSVMFVEVKNTCVNFMIITSQANAFSDVVKFSVLNGTSGL